MKYLYGTMTALGFLGMACAVCEANAQAFNVSVVIGVIGLAMFAGGVFGLKKEGVIKE